jgi:hypothetical protein
MMPRVARRNHEDEHMFRDAGRVIVYALEGRPDRESGHGSVSCL